jgi:hypothetical protein
VHDEFLTRRHHGDWEEVVGGCKQEAKARFPVSRSSPGSTQRGYGEVIVVPGSSIVYSLPGPSLKTSNLVTRNFGYSFFKGELKCLTYLEARQESYRYLKKCPAFVYGLEIQNGAGTVRLYSPAKELA